MDFFQSQDHARKQTGRLVVLFLLAVASLVVLTNLLFMFVFGFAEAQTGGADGIALQLDWQMFFAIGAVVLSVVVLASLYKMSALSRGGEAVAEMLGGARISADGNDLDEQKILNVVEEMAIASGTPVPPVFLIDEQGINAFAAGYSPADAVIGVTRGCIQQLNRNELQGVIAHEFSHILNGDMRLNIRLIGVLHGILIIGLIGYFILRPAGYGYHSHRSRGKNQGGIMALAIGMIVIGYAGTFFGNWIKAAVSRQREYLADASAVQFTRNNMGIANALKRIGLNAAGSNIENPAGAEISHAFFAQGISGFFSSMFATHPPLDKRIKKLDSSWDGNYNLAESERKFSEKNVDASSQKDTSSKAQSTEKFTSSVAAGILLNRVGQPDANSLKQAQSLLQNIPAKLRSEITQAYGARAVIYLLLLNKEADIRQAQLDYLQTESDDGVSEALVKLTQAVKQINNEHRLPLIDMAMPALRQLSLPQYERFKKNISHLIEIDKKVSLFEWSLQKIITHNLQAVFNKATPQRAKYNSLQPLANECSLLLSMLIYVGKEKSFDKNKVMEEAKQALKNVDVKLLPVTEIGLPALNKALDKLNLVKPLVKPALLKACVICITGDQYFSATEAELFRAIASVLDCPMPPVRV
ncbi:Heat shock protein HtpX / FIG017973: domain of unknown function [hydrothermal vent metagenome]|uniref:Peptidase M48 domain-containing protein n=1 Tax=hydrothermal vent metagenome TaxID=652676 RepID=A0A3B0XCX6_9ZZZZ